MCLSQYVFYLNKEVYLRKIQHTSFLLQIQHTSFLLQRRREESAFRTFCLVRENVVIQCVKCMVFLLTKAKL